MAWTPSSKTAKSTKRTTAKTSKNATALSTLEEYQNIAASQKKAHLRAKNTTESYDGQVSRAKEFLVTLVAAKQDAMRQDPNDSAVVPGTSMVPGSNIDLELLSHAFDTTPNRYSAMAVEYFMVEKCLNQNRKASTAVSIHAAFCHYWDHA